MLFRSALQYPIRLAVQKLLGTDAGRIRLSSLVKDASGDHAEVLRSVIESEGAILVDQPVLSPAEQFAKHMDLLPESAARYAVHLVVPNIEFYLKEVNGSIRHKAPNYVEDKLAGELSKVPSDQAMATATRLGQAIARIETERKLTDSEFHEYVWPALLNSCERSDVLVGDLFPAHCVREKVYWYASSELRLSNYELQGCLQKIKDLGNAAKEVKRTAPKGKILVATSLYHEDQIFAALLQTLLLMVEYVDLVVAARDWENSLFTGTAETHFGFANEKESPLFGKDAFPPMYRFRGYYVFARRAWLESLVSAGSPQERGVATSVLQPRKSKLLDNADVKERAWLVRHGNLGFTFEEIARALRRTVDSTRDSELTDSAVVVNQNGTFAFEERGTVTVEEEFEQFVSGRANVFLGGAVHARLIQRWWCSNQVQRAVEVLSPSDIQMLMGEHWPTSNGLLFREDLRGPRHKNFRLALTRLYRGIASLLHTAARSQDEPSRKLLGHLTAVLAEADWRRDKTKWAFVSDPEDLRLLLRQDNVFDVRDSKVNASVGSEKPASSRRKPAVMLKQGRRR